MLQASGLRFSSPSMLASNERKRTNVSAERGISADRTPCEQPDVDFLKAGLC